MLHGKQPGDPGHQPSVRAFAEDPGPGVDAVELVQVDVDHVPVLEDVIPVQAVLGVPFGVLVPVREARFRVVVPAPVLVRVPVRRAARLGAGAFPAAPQ